MDKLVESEAPVVLEGREGNATVEMLAAAVVLKPPVTPSCWKISSAKVADVHEMVCADTQSVKASK